MSEINKPKRKTRTSSAVKNRYNAKTYRTFRFNEKKETAARFEEKLKAENRTISGFFHEAINTYLNEK